MGIKGLWKLISPVAQSMTLHRLAIQEGFVKNVAGGRVYRVGIDASGWVYNSCYHHSSTKNPELATLFARCARLLELPIYATFVFDGPKRPDLKRKKVVRGNDHWSTVDFKNMLVAFGFSYLEAPAEAEAELAWRSKAGLLDAVITEDSDAFVFGSTTVVRLCPNFSKTGLVEVYHATQITELGYDLPALVLIALLVGGDYSDGIMGCGIEIAQHIAQSGLGSRLLAGSQTHKSLLAFRSALCLELSRAGPGLQARCHHLVDVIPPVFPDLIILNLYTHPSTTEHTSSDPIHPRQEFDPSALAIFAEEHFVWGDTVGVLKRFAQHVFPAIALHELVRSAAASDLGLCRQSCPSISTVTHCRNNGPEREAEMRVILNINTHIMSIRNTIKGTRDTPSTPNNVKEFMAKVHRAWLPSVMLQAAVPELLLKGKGIVPVVATASDSEGTSDNSMNSLSTNKIPPKASTVLGLPSAVIDLTSPPPTIDLTSSPPKMTSGLLVNEGPKRYRIEVSSDNNVLEFFSDSDGNA